MNSINDLLLAKNNRKISMVTCYDYWSAQLIAQSEIDLVLVGDSLTMVMAGHSSTVNADIEQMAYHTANVRRGVGDKFLIADMPFLAHRGSIDKTMSNAKRLMSAGANAIKIEYSQNDENTISRLIDSGIPVVGHLGLTPQSVNQFGGYKVQGKSVREKAVLLEKCKLLERIGCCCIVLECIPTDLAKSATELVKIPTIGIGAGMQTDGQVLVLQDLLGCSTGHQPRFVRKFLDGQNQIIDALNSYNNEVKEQTFPTEAESYK